MKDDIITLQEMVAHHSDDIEKLNYAIYEQHKQITALQEQITQLKTQLKAATQQSLIRSESEETPPPHY